MLSAGDVRAAFSSAFGRECDVVTRAPGRVNLIGDHTDYNEGFVLPIAIEQCTWVACAARDDNEARVATIELDEEHEWRLDQCDASDAPHWATYLIGVAQLLRNAGAHLSGFDLLIKSDIPPGGGLSSSAALVVSTALALGNVSGEPLETTEMIDLCVRAERDYAGVPCGLMDPAVALLAKEGAALSLDCRSRRHEFVPVTLPDCELLVIDSGVRHNLADGEYELRRRQCASAVEYFRSTDADVAALRDVRSATVRSHASQMDPLLVARALHVASENERVRDAVGALRDCDAAGFGQLMNASHRSLRDDYEASCPQADRLVDFVRSDPGTFGARLTGGGFGGCVVVLASLAAADRIVSVLGGDSAPACASVYRVRPAAGAGIHVASARQGA